MSRARRLLAGALACALAGVLAGGSRAAGRQHAGGARPAAAVGAEQLEAASRGRVVRVGPAEGGGGVVVLPLERYVAGVLAGEGEPRAAEAARDALAIAIRTYALANAGRHARAGFDLCDSTHCQVLRADTADTRRSALATAGLVLMHRGRPAEVFYSASCGGHSESAAQVWPGLDHPYLQAAPDDVHASDPVWTTTLSLARIEAALRPAGFRGRLRDVQVSARSASGRAARLAVTGLTPAAVSGEQLRAAVGATTLRSTAFTVERAGADVRFTGRGFGHGVGMCVIGAGRRAVRGETRQAILAHYYPGAELTSLDGSAASQDDATRAGRAGVDRAIDVHVGPSAGIAAGDLEEWTLEAHDDLSKVLGLSVAPITVRVHDSADSFAAATGRPWWTGSAADGTSIDLVPPALITTAGLRAALRTAVAELLLGPTLRDRPAWVLVGAARFFADPPRLAIAARASAECPTDAELERPVSNAALQDARARARACFARQYADGKDWRAVR